MIRTATFVADVSDQFAGDAAVYRVEPPMDTDTEPTGHVVVSSAFVMLSGPETYIFPSDEHGNVSSWLELEGSTRGNISHEDALENAGYRVTETSRNTP